MSVIVTDYVLIVFVLMLIGAGVGALIGGVAGGLIGAGLLGGAFIATDHLSR